MGAKFSENGIIYSVNKSGEVMVRGIVNPNQNHVVIPSEIKGHPVLAIGPKAFYATKINSVVLPNSIVMIDQSAFEECRNLKSVGQLGEHSTRAIIVNSYAFRNCRKLNLLSLKHDMLLLGTNAFAFCESIVLLPTVISVSTIYDGAFYNCKSLSSIKFAGPHKLIIDPNAFSNCNNLKKITFDCKVELTFRLKQMIKNMSIYTRGKNSNIVDLVYDGYEINLLEE